jgi:hypothetical protein
LSPAFEQDQHLLVREEPNSLNDRIDGSTLSDGVIRLEVFGKSLCCGEEGMRSAIAHVATLFLGDETVSDADYV